MEAVKEIGWVGMGVRFLVALVLVFVTYNPEGYSFIDWLTMKDAGPMALKALVGVILVIGWTIYLRATLRSLGGFGMVLVIALMVTLLWLLITWNVISHDSTRAIVYMAEVIISVLLAVGIVWSHVSRRLTGQVDVDEIEDD
jgi:cation transport ATPase